MVSDGGPQAAAAYHFPVARPGNNVYCPQLMVE